VNVQVRLRRIARVSHPAYLLPLPDTIPRSHRNTRLHQVRQQHARSTAFQVDKVPGGVLPVVLRRNPVRQAVLREEDLPVTGGIQRLSKDLISCQVLRPGPLRTEPVTVQLDDVEGITLPAIGSQRLAFQRFHVGVDQDRVAAVDDVELPVFQRGREADRRVAGREITAERPGQRNEAEGRRRPVAAGPETGPSPDRTRRGGSPGTPPGGRSHRQSHECEPVGQIPRHQQPDAHHGDQGQVGRHRECI